MHEIMNYYTHSLISDKIYTKFWYCQFEKKKFPKMLSSTEFQFGPIVKCKCKFADKHAQANTHHSKCLSPGFALHIVFCQSKATDPMPTQWLGQYET